MDNQAVLTIPREYLNNDVESILFTDVDGAENNELRELPLPLQLEKTYDLVVQTYEIEQIKRAINPDYNIKAKASAKLQGYKPPTLQWNDRDDYIQEMNAMRQAHQALEADRASNDGLSSSGPSDALSSLDSDVELEGVEGSADQHRSLKRAASGAPPSPKSGVEMEGADSSAAQTRPLRKSARIAEASRGTLPTPSPRNPGAPSRQGRRR